MKITIAGGTHKADYIISMYKQMKNDLVVINEDISICKWLSEKNNISVFNGNISKTEDLLDAGVKDSDVFIALSNDDVRNYVACKCAKSLLNVKRCIATVMNPKNVETFKELGIDSVISSTYLLAQQIKNESAIESLFKTISFEDEKIVIIEVMIKENSKVVNKKLSDLNISSFASISCINRDNSVLIPNGNSILVKDDKLYVVTTKENEVRIMDFFSEVNEK